MSITIRIKDCIENHDKYVGILATKSDKELAKKLDLVHIQMELAERNKNTGSLELLEIWRAQIIEARILKAENRIPDALSEIGIAITDMETLTIKAEERQAILNKISSTINNEKEAKQYQEKEKRNSDKPEQLSLF